MGTHRASAPQATCTTLFTSAAVAILAAGSLAGCYSAAIPTPARPALPTLVDGQEVSYSVSEDPHYYESNGRLRHTRGTTLHSMTYGDTELTYHELRSLADPTWNQKLDAHEALVQRCHRANIPRYIGYGAVLAGSLLMYFGTSAFGDNKTAQYGTAGGLLAVGAGTYAAGYLFFGGQACEEANNMAAEMHFDIVNEKTLYNDEAMKEISEVAKRYNKKLASQQATADRGHESSDE